jgi:DNA-binding XRE family transcriptional regulator
MTPTKSGDYEYSFKSIVEVRTKLRLSQVDMAKKLGVPTTTLYRWETGATKPDASSLASIYSIAMENGIKPNFFPRRSQLKEKKPVREKLLIMWDFQNMPVSAKDVPEIDKWIRVEMGRRFPTTTRRRFKAFAHTSQTDATDALLDLEWKVYEDDSDMDEELIDQSRSECLQDPENVILVIITQDRDYAELIEELKLKGVRVYVMTSQNTGKNLIELVGNKRWILWPGPSKVLLVNQTISNRNFVINRPQVSSIQDDYDDDDD